jgi:hypothetical protein
MSVRISLLMHFVRFAWPPALGATVFTTLALLRPTEIEFRNTHGFYSICILLSLIAAGGYTIRLRPTANEGKRSLAWIVNGLYLFVWAIALVVSMVLGR